MSQAVANHVGSILANHPPGDITFWSGWRELLLGADAKTGAGDLAEAAPYLAALREDDWHGREWLTSRMLDAGVCPVHERDYASCFETADPECAALRRVYPVH